MHMYFHSQPSEADPVTQPAPVARDAMFDSMLNLMRVLRERLDQSAQGVGLTFSRGRVVAVLSRMEGTTQTQLAHAFQVEPPTLKRQLDALEAEGLVERRPMEGDKRKRGLFLTDHARACSLDTMAATIREQVMSGLGPEERETLRRGFDHLAHNIEKMS